MAVTQRRKTNKIRYNLFDRGRALNGIDRSNVNMKSMIGLINSAKIQELVETNVLLGYYGHQVRQRYGMIPPETAFVGGKLEYLEPAVRTIYLKAYENGDVEHITEFLDTQSGEYARRQYVAKVGGFSTAVVYQKNSLPREPIFLGGFDYVHQPNWSTNNGDGELYDSLYLPDELSENECAFDSMTDIALLAPHQADIARQLEQSYLNQKEMISARLQLGDMQLQARKLELQEQRKAEVYTGMVGTVINDFDSMVSKAEKDAERVRNLILPNDEKAPNQDNDYPDANKKAKWFNAFKNK